ncbi:hypothetical protein [Actinomadura chibensis]|uniref:Uncharacterized protein n=1 Tax=Actinomadura chibensis TaxID=392828 RepID=A0A5D0NWL5_9ACTN|nr:hypothetical protein [Actinomadura chibensis]TYB48845.1 hypothetical protein FXF69_06730 [Actinomadura chibensis]
MAGGAAWPGAVSVLARRAVRRVLVLAGLVVAGWLLGCAAQAAAHADELPAVPSRVVAGTPVLGSAVETAPRPVGHVVQEVSEKAPVEREPVTLAPPPPPLESPAISGISETPRPAAKAHESRAVPAGHSAPAAPLIQQRRAVKIGHVAPAAGGRAAHRIVRQHPAPMRAPAPPGDHSTIGGTASSGVIAGFPNVLAWTPAPPRASVPRALGALPPAVRTAADEPSFAPD